MVRDSKRKDKGPKESQFKKFVKKRAPIYLGIVALFIVFVVPELTKGDLQSSLPEDLTEEETKVVDALLTYKGSDGEGLSVMDAVSEKIEEEYPNEKIYDDKETQVNISVANVDPQNYQVLFSFESHKGKIAYDWNVDMSSDKITGNDESSKHIVDLVDFYD